MAMFFSAKSFFIRSKSWFLIAFLSLLPGLIFLWDWNPEGEKIYRNEAVRLEWFNNSEISAEKFLQSSRPRFWQKLVSQRFSQVFLKQLERKNDPLQAMQMAWKVCRPKQFPQASLHFFLKDGSDWEIHSQGETFAISQYLLRKLFNEMVLKAQGKKSDLDSATWQQRLKLLFGHMIFPEQFGPDLRGVPFAALLKTEPVKIVWDLLSFDDKADIDAGFFIYFPDSFDAPQLPAGLIMEYWHLITRQKDIFPVLLPVRPGKTDFYVHANIDTPEFRQALLEFHRNQVKLVPSNVPDLSSKTRLPGEKMGSAFMLKDKLVRLCHLNPVCGYMGMLVSSPPEAQATLRQTIAYAYFAIAGIVWLLFILRVMIFRELPRVDLRLRVMAWFLAFAAFPAGLTIGAWSSLIQDFESYRIDQLQKGLSDTLQSVESGFSQIDNQFSKIASGFFTQSAFRRSLMELPSNPETNQQLFARLFEHFSKEKIKLSGAVIVVQGGWYFTQYRSDSLNFGRNSQIEAVASLLDQFLLRADSKRYQSLKVPDESRYLSFKVPAIINVGDLDVYDNFSVFSDSFDRVTDLCSNRRNFFQYISPVNFDGRAFAVAIIYWELTDQFKHTFKECMDREGLRFQEKWGFFPDMALFGVGRSGSGLISKAGNDRGLSEIADFPVEKISSFYDGNDALVMMPSARFADLRYVARVSTANISLMVAREKGFIVFSVALLLLIIVLAASWASIWVSGPLRAFVDRMRQLNSGQAPKMLQINRNDELGLAAASLKNMTDWVLERERLVKFISPKVLQLLAGGNVFKAGAGTIQDVTVLVSDIRSFTSLSETYRPEQIFVMVNLHLQQMAESIRANSGIIDRFVGDAVWAVFFAPVESGGKNALSAAIAMYQTHREIQRQRQVQGEFSYSIGIGIYHGKVLSGVLGDASVRLDFSVVGEALHQAERLEGLTRQTAGLGIIFSEKLRSCADQMNLRYVKIPDEDAYEVIEFAE